jgi:hypothetical protein
VWNGEKTTGKSVHWIGNQTKITSGKEKVETNETTRKSVRQTRKGGKNTKERGEKKESLHRNGPVPGGHTARKRSSYFIRTPKSDFMKMEGKKRGEGGRLDKREGKQKKTEEEKRNFYKDIRDSGEKTRDWNTR